MIKGNLQHKFIPTQLQFIKHIYVLVYILYNIHN
jgi:hypothetical protein